MCIKCKTVKPLSDYYKDGNTKDRLKSYCKPCHYLGIKAAREKNRAKYALAAREWRQRDLERARKNSRRHQLKRMYGISMEEYLERKQLQGYICAICNQPENPEKDGLHLDHNHETMQLREFLCRKCNSAIGFLDDNADRVLAAYEYLIKWGC